MEFLALLGALSLTSWLVVVAALFGIMFGVEKEKYGIATIVLLASAVLLVWLTGHGLKDVYHAIADDPSIIIHYVLGFLSIGVVWGVVKWFFFLMRVRDRLVEYRNKHDITGQMSDKQKVDAKDYIRGKVSSYDYTQSLPPKANENKGRIMFWMIWWPFSMPWTLVNEPVKRVFNFIYYRIAGVLQSMSDRLFKGLA